MFLLNIRVSFFAEYLWSVKFSKVLLLIGENLEFSQTDRKTVGTLPLDTITMATRRQSRREQVSYGFCPSPIIVGAARVLPDEIGYLQEASIPSPVFPQL